MKASVIVLSWNGVGYLESCLDAVLAQDYPDFEVIVVDNGSSDGSAELVAQNFPQVQLIRNDLNLGFAGGNNVGLRAATGDVLILLNQDTVVRQGWLAALVAALDDPTVGMAGCKMFYPDGTIQHAGGRLHGARGESEHFGRYEPDSGEHDQPREVDFVTGAAVGLRRSTLVRVGLLDEGFFPAYYEDIDWCYRVRAAGLQIRYWPAAVLTHYESASLETDSYARKAVYHHGRLRLLLKHKPLAWLQGTFAPAEMDWAGVLGRTVEMMAARDAYLRIMLSLPEIFAFRMGPDGVAFGQDPQKEWDGLLALISDLRAVCVQSQPLAEKDQGELREAHPPVEQWRADLETQWEIKELPFHSDVPLVGEGIAAFRQAWNNVAARWYVLPMVHQQIAFNSTLVNLMRFILAGVEDHQRDGVQNTREVDALTREIVRLQRRIEALEKTVAETTE